MASIKDKMLDAIKHMNCGNSYPLRVEIDGITHCYTVKLISLHLSKSGAYFEVIADNLHFTDNEFTLISEKHLLMCHIASERGKLVNLNIKSVILNNNEYADLQDINIPSKLHHYAGESYLIYEDAANQYRTFNQFALKHISKSKITIIVKQKFRPFTSFVKLFFVKNTELEVTCKVINNIDHEYCSCEFQIGVRREHCELAS